MKTAGIIAEYNPFHNGHAYHIEETKRRTGADYIVVIMSGNFVQRGAPALTDKYIRARTALLAGADLVIEMPVCGAVASAETFARCGIGILDSLGCIDWLSFGCETEHAELLEQLAELFTDEPRNYRSALSDGIRQGLSFPAARAQAAAQVLHSQECLSILNHPNNILAVEYLKALKSLNNKKITSCMIQRKGEGYHSTQTEFPFSSATAIRKALLSGQNPSELCMRQMPDDCCDAFLNWMKTSPLVSENDFSEILHYKLMLSSGHYDTFGEKNTALANRLSHAAEQFFSFTDLCIRLKSKERTYTSISRYLTHMILDITSDNMQLFRRYNCAPYARILGFRRTSSPLISALSGSGIPLIHRLAADRSVLSDDLRTLLDIDIRSSHIYDAVVAHKSGHPVCNEFRHPLVYL